MKNKITEEEFLVGVKMLQRIKKLELEVNILREKHILMEKAIERKAGMLEPIREEEFKFRKEMK